MKEGWRRTGVIFVVITICLVPAQVIVAEQDPIIQESFNYLVSNKDYVDLSSISGVVIDLKYASTDNFMRENLYGQFRKAFLHRLAAKKLEHAARLLHERHPNLKIVVYDALRPRSVQRQLWERVKGTAQQSYVAEPNKGSMHNFGFAVDLSIVDEQGREMDMGTKYDDFSPLSEPRREGKYVKLGKLSTAQVSNRQMLRTIMTQTGFIQQVNEWWHYDALSPEDVRANHPIVE